METLQVSSDLALQKPSIGVNILACITRIFSSISKYRLCVKYDKRRSQSLLHCQKFPKFFNKTGFFGI